MQCVILAAGRGVRMGKLTENTPKPMLSLSGKPLLEWKLEMLPKAIDEIILVVGYLEHRIQEHFGNEWQGRPIHYVYQETLNGTGGALTLTKNVVRDRFLVIMGDDLYHQKDLEDLLSDELALLAYKTDEAERFGIIETTKEGRLLSVAERPHGKKEGLVSTNGFMLHRKFFDYPLVPITETEYGLPQTLALMGKDVPVCVRKARAWQPVGRPEDIEKGEAFLKKYWIKNA
ncbi:MAG: nucleotidyltransferase family protein [bacterium]|nr:nucleotidyltransferase family protein [bacterium]